MIFKILLRGTLGQNRKEVLPGGFCLLDFFYQALKLEPPRFPVWQIQSRYPGKNLRKDVSPNPFYSPGKKENAVPKSCGRDPF